MLDNYTDGGKKLVLLDEKCEVTAQAEVSSDVKRIRVIDNSVIVMTESDITQYDYSLASVKKTLLKDSYSDFIKVGGSILLMGYDSLIAYSFNCRKERIWELNFSGFMMLFLQLYL